MQNPLTTMAAAVLCAMSCVANAESSVPQVRFEFLALDANGDDYVDPQEFGVFTDRIREAMRARFGGDREGPADRLLQLYGAADADGDGMLNEAEFDALKAQVESKRGRMRQRSLGGRGGQDAAP